MYKFDYWLQARKMTQEHGGSFLPVFRQYWGEKAHARRANAVSARVATKLHEYMGAWAAAAKRAAASTIERPIGPAASLGACDRDNARLCGRTPG